MLEVMSQSPCSQAMPSGMGLSSSKAAKAQAKATGLIIGRTRVLVV